MISGEIAPSGSRNAWLVSRNVTWFPSSSVATFSFTDLSRSRTNDGVELRGNASKSTIFVLGRRIHNVTGMSFTHEVFIYTREDFQWLGMYSG